MPIEPVLSPDLAGFSCLRCDTLHPVGDWFRGCPSCWESGSPANLRARYGEGRHGTASEAAVPYSCDFGTLTPGNTALIACPPSIAGGLDIRLKCEFQNPTGSHKDRCSAQSVARAKAAGYHTVIAASSGNAGVSLAAYARAAGLACEIAISAAIIDSYRQELEELGARCLVFETGIERWHWMEQRVEDPGVYAATNFALPAVGSSPFGIEGYKAIAHEIRDQLEGRLPAAIAVPHCRGDVLAGIAYGLAEIAGEGGTLPRLVAVDPFPRTAQILSGARPVSAEIEGDAALLPAIGGGTTTFQSIRALRTTQGLATSVSGDAADAMRLRFLAEGLDLERSAVVSVIALRDLAAEGKVPTDQPLVALLTGKGREGI